MLKRDLAITQASRFSSTALCCTALHCACCRDDTGPAVSGRRPVIVTFESFK